MFYKIDLSKLGRRKLKNVQEGLYGDKYVIFDSLSIEAQGDYKCEVSRPVAGYYDYQYVKITIKGNVQSNTLLLTL